MLKKLFFGTVSLLLCLSITCTVFSETPKLTISGNNFVDSEGNPVRFWGFNLVSLYPTHEQAEGIAEELSQLGVNVVRPHHLFRDGSGGWNNKSYGGSGINSLVDYQWSEGRVLRSSQKNETAYERFDYLNAKLKEKGIYTRLTLDANGTHVYGENDADILQTTDTDAQKWSEAMRVLNSLYWSSAISLRRMVQGIDERVQAINEKIIRDFLSHTNPYTGLRYGDDPQTLTFEVANETSIEYLFICGNRFENEALRKSDGSTELTDAEKEALSYFGDKMDEKWKAYLTSIGIASSEHYSLYDSVSATDTVKQKRRSDFLRKLDEDWFRRVKQIVTEEFQSDVPITYSTFWQGDTNLNMHVTNGDYIEEHSYPTAAVTDGVSDFTETVQSQTKVEGMPYFIGELNQTEKTDSQNIPARTNLILAAAAYGAFNNWTGINFFAWNHGDIALSETGAAKSTFRLPNLAISGTNTTFGTNERSDMIGNLVRDEMMLDHMRTAGILYKNGLVSQSNQPKIIYVDEPYFAAGYSPLMTPKYKFQSGWQNIHSISRKFTDSGEGVPVTQKNSPLLLTAPTQTELVSDTDELIKNTAKKQLLVTAAAAEGFAGSTYANESVKLKHLELTNPQNGNATVIMVSDTGKSLSRTNHIILSRTALAHDLTADMSSITGTEYNLPITIKGLTAPNASQYWQMTVTRPAGLAGTRVLTPSADGSLTLPTDIAWNECELTLTDTIQFTLSGAENGLSYDVQEITGKLELSTPFADSVEAVMAWYENGILKQAALHTIKPEDDSVTFDAFLLPAQTAAVLATTGGNTYTDSSLKADTNYEYTVQGYDANDQPVGTPIVIKIKTPAEEAVPTPVQKLQANHINGTSVTLQWNANANEEVLYRIYRNNSLLADNLSENTYTDTSLTCDTAYTYKVTAISRKTGLESAPTAINLTTLSEDNLLFSIYKDGTLGSGLTLWGTTADYGCASVVQDTVPEGKGLDIVPDGTKVRRSGIGSSGITQTPGTPDKMASLNFNWHSVASGAEAIPANFEGIINNASLDLWMNVMSTRQKFEIGLTSQTPGTDEIYHLRVPLSDYIDTTDKTNVGDYKSWQKVTVPLRDLLTNGACYQGTNISPEASQNAFDLKNVIGFTVAMSNESGAHVFRAHDIKLINTAAAEETPSPVTASSLTATTAVLNWDTVPGAAYYTLSRRGGNHTVKLFFWEQLTTLKPKLPVFQRN